MPERNLLTAVLRRALFDLRNGTAVERTAAKEWFFENGDYSPFSFTWVCTHLDIEPEQLLERIGKLRAQLGPKRTSLEAAALN